MYVYLSLCILFRGFREDKKNCAGTNESAISAQGLNLGTGIYLRNKVQLKTQSLVNVYAKYFGTEIANLLGHRINS